jgi:hypothetical protein
MGREHCKMVAAFQLDDAEVFAGGFGRGGVRVHLRVHRAVRRRQRSTVERALQGFRQILDVVITQSSGQPQRPRMNDKALRWRSRRTRQPDARKMIYRALERSTATPQLTAQQLDDIFIERGCHAHMTMLSDTACCCQARERTTWSEGFTSTNGGPEVQKSRSNSRIEVLSYGRNEEKEHQQAGSSCETHGRNHHGANGHAAA